MAWTTAHNRDYASKRLKKQAQAAAAMLRGHTQAQTAEQADEAFWQTDRFFSPSYLRASTSDLPAPPPPTRR